jgi:hypothetical protein
MGYKLHRISNISPNVPQYYAICVLPILLIYGIKCQGNLFVQRKFLQNCNTILGP